MLLEDVGGLLDSNNFNVDVHDRRLIPSCLSQLALSRRYIYA